MRKLLLISLCCINLLSLKAQLKLDYHASYATYSMSDMTDLLYTIKISDPFNQLGMRIVEDFPAYIAHSVNIGYRLFNHEFGIKSGFYSTGGKLSVGDYSGKINTTLTTNGFREGVYYRNYFYTFEKEDSRGNQKDRLSIWGEMSPAVIISTLKIRTVVSNVELQETLKEYNENVYSLLFQLGSSYYVNRKISLDLSVGYDLSFGGEFGELRGSPRADWSGLRLSCGLGLTL